MKKIIVNYFKKDELARNGILMFVSGLISGGFNYFYQIYMGRMLGPEQYGIFGALFAISYLIGVISQTIGTSTTLFVSKFIGEEKKIGFFIKGCLKRFIIIGITVATIFFSFRNELMNIFKIGSLQPLFVLTIILFLTWIEPVISGALRGIKLFGKLAIIGISNSFFKLIFGVSLVKIGFGASGALTGVLFGILAGLFLSIIFIKPYILKNNPHDPDFRFKELYSYSLPVMLVMVCYSIVGNFDVILAKYYFSDVEAGIYNSVSILGKIVLFLPGSITMVMFPMITENHFKGENVNILLKKGMIYTGILSGIVSSVYVIYPQIVIKIFGVRYIEAVGLVGQYGIIMFSLSLIGVLVYFHLAVKDMTYIGGFILFTLIEVGLLIMLGSTIVRMIEVILFSNLVFLMMSIGYLFRHKIIAKILDNG